MIKAVFCDGSRKSTQRVMKHFPLSWHRSHQELPCNSSCPEKQRWCCQLNTSRMTDTGNDDPCSVSVAPTNLSAWIIRLTLHTVLTSKENKMCGWRGVHDIPQGLTGSINIFVPQFYCFSYTATVCKPNLWSSSCYAAIHKAKYANSSYAALHDIFSFSVCSLHVWWNIHDAYLTLRQARWPVQPVLVAEGSGQTALSGLGWSGDKCWDQSWVFVIDPQIEEPLM